MKKKVFREKYNEPKIERSKEELEIEINLYTGEVKKIKKTTKKKAGK